MLNSQYLKKRLIEDIFGKPVAANKMFDVLILSDSIYRHVGGSCPKKNDVQSPIIDREFTLEVGFRWFF